MKLSGSVKNCQEDTWCGKQRDACSVVGLWRVVSVKIRRRKL